MIVAETSTRIQLLQPTKTTTLALPQTLLMLLLLSPLFSIIMTSLQKELGEQPAWNSIEQFKIQAIVKWTLSLLKDTHPEIVTTKMTQNSTISQKQ